MVNETKVEESDMIMENDQFWDNLYPQKNHNLQTQNPVFENYKPINNICSHFF